MPAFLVVGGAPVVAGVACIRGERGERVVEVGGDLRGEAGFTGFFEESFDLGAGSIRPGLAFGFHRGDQAFASLGHVRVVLCQHHDRGDGAFELLLVGVAAAGGGGELCQVCQGVGRGFTTSVTGCSGVFGQRGSRGFLKSFELAFGGLGGGSERDDT